jgi:dTDP-4-amino-4,6-dideoxygalactose transaminase
VRQKPTVSLNDLSRIDELTRIEISSSILEVLNSGVFLGGSRVKGLENSISQLLNGYKTVAVASGTDALYVALKTLGIDSRCVVVTVGNASGYATNAILRCGASPWICDIDPDTAQMSPEHIETIVASSTPVSAVIVTHLYGLLGEIEEIADICSQNGVFLIEDCAQSFGAIWSGKRAGAWGDAAAFSFYPTKNLAALGDGGLVAFKKSEDVIRAKKIAQYGWSSRYEVELLGGINSRLDEIQAAVVLHRLTSVDAKNARRREILGRYARSVVAPRRFIFEDSSRCVAHLGVMRTPSRESDQARLRDAGIETSIHYPIPDHHQPAWRHLFEGVQLPNTEAHCREALTLPCFPELTEDEITRVCQALREL